MGSKLLNHPLVLFFAWKSAWPFALDCFSSWDNAGFYIDAAELLSAISVSSIVCRISVDWIFRSIANYSWNTSWIFSLSVTCSSVVDVWLCIIQLGLVHFLLREKRSQRYAPISGFLLLFIPLVNHPYVS
jgi:hypothetical protein